MKFARLWLAALLLTFMSTFALATVDRAICTTSDAGVTCTGAELITSANEEIAALDNRAPMKLGSVSGTNTITASVTPTLTAYADLQTFYLKPANDITGAATLNINSIGAKSLTNPSGSAVGSGDLLATNIYLVIYYASGDHFRVLTNLGSGGFADSAGAYIMQANSASFSAERALTAGTAITLTDGGVNSTMTVGVTAAAIGTTQIGTDGVSADELNATGVEAELEAVIDLADLQGDLPLGTKTSGNYALGDAEGGAATTGDSATAFFSAGTLEDARIDGSAEADEVNPTLGTQTQGNYMVDLSAGAGIAVTHTPAEGSTGTIALSYADAGASPSLGADACQFTSNATTGGFIVCEGDTADAFESRITVTDPTADRLFTIPDANSNSVQPLTCSGSDKVSAISAAGVVTCTADSGASGGDSVTVNGGATTDPDFDDATPAAVSGANVKWQYSAGDLSGYLAAASTTVIGPSELATSAETEAGSDTARTVTPAGLLAAFSGVKTISIPGGAIINATTSGCTPAQLESATNKINQKICGFTSTSADEFGWFQFTAPKSWDEGTITAQFFWTSASGSGDVVWSLACLARSDDDAMDTALGTAVTVTDTQLTAGDLMISAATSAVTVGGTPAENDEIFCRVARVGSNGSDTFSGTAQLSAVKVLYTINAMTDD